MILNLASGNTLFSSSEIAASDLENTEVRASFRQTYHEIADRHVVETDVIEQLRANLSQLEDIQGRMHFMMKELSYLLKKS